MPSICEEHAICLLQRDAGEWGRKVVKKTKKMHTHIYIYHIYISVHQKSYLIYWI